MSLGRSGSRCKPRLWRVSTQASPLARFSVSGLPPTSRRDSKRLLRPFLSHLKGISEATRRGHCGSKAPARSDCAIKQIAHARCRRGVSEKSRPVGSPPTGRGAESTDPGVRCCLLMILQPNHHMSAPSQPKPRGGSRRSSSATSGRQSRSGASIGNLELLFRFPA
jgi:hypothetical protein